MATTLDTERMIERRVHVRVQRVLEGLLHWSEHEEAAGREPVLTEAIVRAAERQARDGEPAWS